MELKQWYVFKYCAPTRGMLNTGRFPFHFGFYNNQDANDYGVPLNYTMLPAVLKKEANYRTHAIGKWHMGFRSPGLTPIGRGYDTFLGYCESPSPLLCLCALCPLRRRVNRTART